MDTIESARHFGDDDWFEYSSRSIAPERAAPMRTHLANGCAVCTKAYETWSLIVATAAGQSQYDPPAHVLEAVKAAFALARDSRSGSRVAVIAQLVFDSFRDPLPEGVRGGISSVRHLLHEAGDYAIDLRLESGPNGQMYLDGQVVRKNAKGHDAAGAGVVLVTREGSIACQTIANSMGEFQMEVPETSGLVLCVEILKECVIAIVLPGTSGDSTT